MTSWTPTEVLPPGEFIKDALEVRGWTQLDLADVIGRTPRHVNELINGKSGVTPRTAKELAAAFETSAEFWLNLENQFQLSRTVAEDAAVSRRAKLYRLPIRAMTKRGWIEKTDDLDALEADVLKFSGATSLDEIETFRHAARRSTGDDVTDLQMVWLYRVKQIARSMHVGAFSAAKLHAALSELQRYRAEPREIRHVPRVLREAGIRFVVSEAPEGSKIDGVCFWLSDNQPVIGMSLRLDRIDNFWFVLRHEIEHVLCRHGLDQTILDVDSDEEGQSSLEEERVANAAAAEFCAPQQRIAAFIARKQPYISERDVLAFARICDVHPGLIVGQIHRRLKNYKNFRAYLVSVSREIQENAVIDGWGHVAPI